MKFFKVQTVAECIKDLNREGGAEKYWSQEPFSFKEDQFITDDTVNSAAEKIKLEIGGNKAGDDYANAIKIYEALPGLTYSQASSPLIWTYLTHVPFFNYVQRRYPIERAGDSHIARAIYVQRHWFINPINWHNIIRNNAISRLWWMVALSIVHEEADKYLLTKELFSMQDYTAHLMTYPLGRSIDIRHGLLKFVASNPNLFVKYKEAKIRFIMRSLNLEAGGKIVTFLTKAEIIDKLMSMQTQIASIVDK